MGLSPAGKIGFKPGFGKSRGMAMYKIVKVLNYSDTTLTLGYKGIGINNHDPTK